MLARCESCKSVLHYGFFGGVHCGQPLRKLTEDEVDAYVAHGHEAFDDLRAVKDEQGGILAYLPA